MGPQLLVLKGNQREAALGGARPFMELVFKWQWLKIQQGGLRRFWSMFPLTRVPFWYRFFEPQPNGKEPD